MFSFIKLFVHDETTDYNYYLSRLTSHRRGGEQEASKALTIILLFLIIASRRAFQALRRHNILQTEDYFASLPPWLLTALPFLPPLHLTMEIKTTTTLGW